MEIVGKKRVTETLKICIFSFLLLNDFKTHANDLIGVIEKKITPLNQYNSDFNEHGYWFQMRDKTTFFGYFDRGKKKGIWLCFETSTSNLKEVRAYNSDTLKMLFRCSETVDSRFEFMDSSFVRNKFCIEYFDEKTIVKTNNFEEYKISNQDFFKGFTSDSELLIKIEFIEGISFCLQQNVRLESLISFKLKSNNDHYLIFNFAQDSLNTGEYKLSQLYNSNKKKLNGQRFIFNPSNGELLAVIEYRDGFINGKTSVLEVEKGQMISVDFINGKATKKISKKENLVLLKYFDNYRRYYFPKLETNNPWNGRYTNWENEIFIDGYIGTSANGSIYKKATGLPGYIIQH